MSTPLTARRYCPDCRRHVLAIYYSPALGLHVLATLMTCGLWLPMLIGFAVLGRYYRCKYCGKLL